MTTNGLLPVVRSEWVKIRSTVASMITLPLGLAVSVGISLINGFSTRAAIDRGSAMLAPDFNPIEAGFVGLFYGNLAFVVFAVLVFSSEYTSGMIRSSLWAVPGRGLFYLCKVGVTGAILLGAGAVAAVASFAAAQVALGPHGSSFGAAGAAQALFGAVAYVTLLGVFSVAVAAILRSTALTLGILMPLFFVVSPALAAIPGTEPVARFLPDQAGMRAMSVHLAPGDLTPAQGVLVLSAWALAAVVAGSGLVRYRDA